MFALLPAAQALESLAGLGVEAVAELRARLLAVLDGSKLVAHEVRRRDLLHLDSGGAAHGGVGGDEADALARPVLGRESLEQRVGVRRVAHGEPAELALLAGPVEADAPACAARRDEARERVGQLAHVREAARVQEVVAVEEVEGRIGHLPTPAAVLLPTSTKPQP